MSYDDTLPYRIAFGLTFFAALAVWEVARNGRRSARLRKYGFLLIATTVSIIFAVLHECVAALRTARGLRLPAPPAAG